MIQPMQQCPPAMLAIRVVVIVPMVSRPSFASLTIENPYFFNFFVRREIATYCSYKCVHAKYLQLWKTLLAGYSHI